MRVPVITLYGPRQAPFTEKVRRGLIYKGYDFRLVEPDGPEDYKRWSPKTGQLPVLDLNGESIPDSTDILLRIDRDRPDPPLLSTQPNVAAQQRQLEEWADESFLFYYLKYRRLTDGVEAPMPTRAEADGVLEGGDATSGTLRRIGAWLRAGGTWERPHTGILREVGLRMDDLVNFLGARPFFYAQDLSMADLGVYSMLHTMRVGAIPGSEKLLGERPSLVAFMGRVEERTGGAEPSAAA
ncbi:MAG: glutathione S-transferase family protein [Myxococcota bacterium]